VPKRRYMGWEDVGGMSPLTQWSPVTGATRRLVGVIKKRWVYRYPSHPKTGLKDGTVCKIVPLNEERGEQADATNEG
jgi:hypothetical protein